MSVTEKVVTLNDLYTDRLSDVPAVLNTTRPFALLVQEGKNTRYRRVLKRMRRAWKKANSEGRGKKLAPPPSYYRQVQITKSDAQAGLAIIWNAEKAPRLSGPHYRELVQPHGAEMLPRGILWVVVDHPQWGPTVLATSHRPPFRYRFLWPAYDRALGDWVRARRQAVILLGMDTNTHDLRGMTRVGLSVAGKGIDAVLGRGVI